MENNKNNIREITQFLIILFLGIICCSGLFYLISGHIIDEKIEKAKLELIQTYHKQYNDSIRNDSSINHKVYKLQMNR